MTWAVYSEKEGYIGDVTAPTRERAVAFLEKHGYQPGTYELRELTE